MAGKKKVVEPVQETAPAEVVETHVVTQETLDMNPELKAEGVEVGDVVELHDPAPVVEGFKVNFGVEIPKMGKFTKEELEVHQDACEYLHGIGSPAVTKL